MIDRIPISNKTYRYISLLAISLIVLNFALPIQKVYAASPPVELKLNTVIEPVSTFTLSDDDIEITIGDVYTLGYTLTGNVPLKVRITSTTALQPSDNFYMKHTNPSINSKLRYELQFDYGSGIPTNVAPFTYKNMLTSNQSGEIKIITFPSEAEYLPEGVYKDTVTFSFLAQ